MKYKVGDKVRIKSLEWYEKHHDYRGRVHTGGGVFTPSMVEYCGKEAIITGVSLDVYQMLVMKAGVGAMKCSKIRTPP